MIFYISNYKKEGMSYNHNIFYNGAIDISHDCSSENLSKKERSKKKPEGSVLESLVGIEHRNHMQESHARFARGNCMWELHAGTACMNRKQESHA